ncbi:ATP-binding protein [Candidatus Bipolaricaulota bacterium]|nr:ATP-binding protein [Candidatus Bipolaricaulota bacterium]
MISGAPIGKRFRKASFSNFDVTSFNSHAFEACKALVDGKNLGVVLIGPVGVGKTHLLVALIHEYDRRNSYVPEAPQPTEEPVQIPSASELIANADADTESMNDSSAPSLHRSEIERRTHIEYWPMLDLASELRNAAMTGDQSISLRCRNCNLLILDDLGREKISDFILQEFQRIIDWRYREMLPIAVATNFQRGDIADRYDEHTTSRWIGSCVVVEVRGPDYRMDS